MRPQFLYTHLALVVLSTSFAGGADEGFLGRRDLTVTSGSTEYPSWLEVSRADGKLAGRFVGRSGSVLPAEVKAVGEEILFAPERPPRAKASVAAQSYRGRLANGKLEGTGVDSQGHPIRWVGVRVVRPPASRREPRWGAPVSLFNGKTIIENQEIDGITGGALDSNETAPGPIMLQGDHGKVRFRNIVVTPGN